MKNMKVAVSLAVALAAVAAAICTIVVFQEEIAKLYGSCKDACCKAIRSKKEEIDEYADFADV